VETKTLLVEQLKIYLMQDGLLPAIRLEQIRDEPATSFAQARDRAKRHEANNLSGNNPTPTITYTSAVTYNPRSGQVPRTEYTVRMVIRTGAYNFNVLVIPRLTAGVFTVLMVRNTGASPLKMLVIPLLT
ncbi:unnamed protein product, partial [Choristocarpus tenellus]